MHTTKIRQLRRPASLLSVASDVHYILLQLLWRHAAPLNPSHLDLWLAGAAKELANMFAYYKRFPYYDQLREPTNCIFKGPSFAEWAKQNVDALKAKVQG